MARSVTTCIGVLAFCRTHNLTLLAICQLAIANADTAKTYLKQGGLDLASLNRSQLRSLDALHQQHCRVDVALLDVVRHLRFAVCAVARSVSRRPNRLLFAGGGGAF